VERRGSGLKKITEETKRLYGYTDNYKPGIYITEEVHEVSLKIKLAYEETDSLKELFEEYTKLLVDLDSDFQNYLEIQNYDSEIDNLNEKYGMPNGRLYIAYLDNKVAGCIALKSINVTQCEMKRLYVRPQFRGNKIAKSLVEIIINDAKKIGYQYMLLDTFPALKDAIRLYEKIGFYRIPSYNNSPVNHTIFMKLDLYAV
jgi:ribosomal protein S18 acetylase RimI-like enzyme